MRPAEDVTILHVHLPGINIRYTSDAVTFNSARNVPGVFQRYIGLDHNGITKQTN